MSNRTKVRRTLLVSVGFLLVAAAAVAGMRWQSWVPADACLFCSTPEADATSAANGLNRGASSGNGRAGATTGGLAGSTFAPDGAGYARTAGSVNEGTGARSAAASSNGTWQPWSNASGSSRNYSGNGGGTSTTSGGLWRLMSLTRSARVGAAAPPASVAQNHEASTQIRPPAKPGSPAPPAARTPPAESRPPATAAPAPRPPAAAAPTPTPPPATSDGPGNPQPSPAPSAVPLPAPVPSASVPAVSVPPTDPFHEHDKPAPDPFGSVPPAGPLDPGGQGPGAGPGRDPSPTPEPGSILLIGTGLVGIMGALRRRQLL